MNKEFSIQNDKVYKIVNTFVFMRIITNSLFNAIFKLVFAEKVKNKTFFPKCLHNLTFTNQVI